MSLLFARFVEPCSLSHPNIVTAHDAREVNGMVHRDIKPSNVMINRDGKAAYD
ncbi:MAG: hypothetical protein ABGX07_10475 [Pirellulaceae bacterium]